MKYTIVYGENNKIQSNNKNWKKWLKDTGADSLTIYENSTGKEILKAENYCGKMILLESEETL